MKKFSFLFLLPVTLCALEEKPWLDEMLQFHLNTDFTYSYYRNVQGARRQLKAPSNDYLITFEAGVPPGENWDIQLETQFVETPRQSLGFRSVALLGRYQWLDDIAGDPISLTTGLSAREVSRHSNRDVSSPFHSYFNGELHSAVGKEWSNGVSWWMRTFGLLAVGMANQGLPWLRALYDVEMNWGGHRLQLFTEGYFGFGTEQHVNVDAFFGWGKVHHQSIDVGLVYSYAFPIWGILSIGYDQRVFAKNFPQNVHSVLFSYRLPFSLF